jgi:hypothetical protein
MLRNVPRQLTGARGLRIAACGMGLGAFALAASVAAAQTNVNYCQGIVTPPSTRCSELAPRYHYN